MHHQLLAGVLAALLCAAPAQSAQSAPSELPRWDALPALDVAQSHGPYAGQTICPMCQHGYDAGVLLLLPGKAPAQAVGTTLAALREVTHDMDEPRFRIFVVLLEAPDQALREQLGALPPNWYVGTLLAQERAAALTAFGQRIAEHGEAHVFAQRRSLRSFQPLQAVDPGDLAADIAWAQDVLDYTYASPAPSEHPDTPKGLLWTAPSQLHSQATLQADAPSRQICFQLADQHPEAQALVGLRLTSGTSRTVWARTDASGCIATQAGGGALLAELFAWRARPLVLAVPASAPAQTPQPLQIDPTRITGVNGKEPVLGRCDGCEAVYTALPSRLPSLTRLTAADRPGEPLHIRGRILDDQGQPRAGIVVYAYQTDATGQYPPAPHLPGAAARHGKLRGWAISDAQGRYGFDTIRPASYPDSAVEQHVHMHLIEPRRCTYYLGDLLFDDDPKLSPQQRQRATIAHGGSGVVRLTGDAGGWWAKRDVYLGKNVAGYEECGD